MGQEEIKQGGEEDDFPMDDVMEENSTKHTEDDFKRIKVIGKGSYGKVFLVRKLIEPSKEGGNYLGAQKVEGDLYAMKVLKKADLRARKQVEHTKSERRILERISHPFIVGLH